MLILHSYLLTPQVRPEFMQVWGMITTLKAPCIYFPCSIKARNSFVIQFMAEPNSSTGCCCKHTHDTRELVLCFDGTGNTLGRDDTGTNILRIFRILDRTKENRCEFFDLYRFSILMTLRIVCYYQRMFSTFSMKIQR